MSGWKKVNSEIKYNTKETLQLFTTAKGFPVFLASDANYRTKHDSATQLYKKLYPHLQMVVIEPTRAYVGSKWVTYNSPFAGMILAVPVVTVAEMKDLTALDLDRVIAEGYAEQLTRSEQSSEARERHLKSLRAEWIRLVDAPAAMLPSPSGYSTLMRIATAQKKMTIKIREDQLLADLISSYKELQ